MTKKREAVMKQVSNPEVQKEFSIKTDKQKLANREQNVSEGKNKTLKVDNKTIKSDKMEKTKLNPNAAQYKAKTKAMDQVSCPNLNTESDVSGTYPSGNGKKYSYKDLFIPQQYPARKTNLEVSQKEEMDEVQVNNNLPRNAVANCHELSDLLRQYILKKCSLNNHCNSNDFDGAALDGLTRLSFVQSFQAVEHYGASVSQRIIKKAAYLMGIIRGQESHWNNSRAAAQLEGGALQLLHMPKRVMQQVGQYCLHGNCLPSDFTPEVLLSLHSLTVDFAMKAIKAFDSNKRIVAGCRGGVVNRPRFLQRLIENVIQQNPLSLAMIKKEKEDNNTTDQSMYSSPKSFLSLLGSNSRSNTMQSSSRDTPNSCSSRQNEEVKLGSSEKMKFLERELTDRIERERRLRQELGNLKVQVSYWEKECHRLNSSITHIMQNNKE